MIGIGDKVVITFGNCAHRIRVIGETTVVRDVIMCGSHCVVCGVRSQLGIPHAICQVGDWWPCYVPLAWLTKIEPDAERETRSHEQYVEA